MPELPTEDNISIKRKRLLFRSWHRGTREMDFLLGRFAEASLPGMDEPLLDAYDAFLSNSDPDIYNWLTGQEPVPPQEQGPVMQMMLDFYKA
jgi:antitoxin CptB